MANIMTKRGNQDNVITYEHICDTTADMANIENKYKTLGSVCIVIKGESGGLEVYMMGSNKEWVSITEIAGGSSSTTAGLNIHICTSEEVDSLTSLPDINEPLENTLYLVTNTNETNNLYKEYVYVNDGWELVGSADIDLSSYATKADTVLTSTLSRGRKENTTIGVYSSAFGYDVEASGEITHAEGRGTVASGDYSHAEGNYTTASGSGAHAEGQSTVASAYNTHAEGLQTKARGNYSHAEGKHDNGTTTATIGNTTIYYGASGVASHSEGANTVAHADASHAEGTATIAFGASSHAEGNATTASGIYSHSEGDGTLASGSDSHAEGYGGTFTLNDSTYTSGAQGMSDHTEGYQTRTASAMPGHHAEGYQTAATGGAAHAEGSTTSASGTMSHAEGQQTWASGAMSHAEGFQTTASGSMSHTEGWLTTSYGNMSHAEGEGTVAAGHNSHVQGSYNVADSYSNWPAWTANTAYSVGDKVKRTASNTVSGYVCKTAHTSGSTFSTAKWNSAPHMNYVEIVGNGTADNARSNARILDWDGNERLRGDVYVGCNADSTGGTKLEPLPTVTSSDEGKVLTVNSSGAWAAANASGGGNIFVVGITYNDNTSTYSMNKTWTEIFNAVKAHKFILGEWEREEEYYDIFTCYGVENDSGIYYVRMILGSNDNFNFSTNSENGYPEYVDN